MEHHHRKTHRHVKRAQFLTMVAIGINLAMFIFMYVMLTSQISDVNSRVSTIRTDLQDLDYKASENFVAISGDIGVLSSELDETTEEINLTKIVLEGLGAEIIKVEEAGQSNIENLREELDYTGTIYEAMGAVVLIIWTDKTSVVGSGFLVSEDGYVLTAEHVIDSFEGNTVRVETQEGDLYIASVEEADKRRDVAVLKITIENASYLDFGDSNRLAVGSKVFALGAPEGFSFSASEGIVSAVRSVKEIEEDTGLDIGLDNDITIVQTDAAITNGNSGGPLIDTNGNVVGVNSFGVSRNNGGAYQDVAGLNFAIASNDAQEVYGRL